VKLTIAVLNVIHNKTMIEYNFDVINWARGRV